DFVRHQARCAGGTNHSAAGSGAVPRHADFGQYCTKPDSAGAKPVVQCASLRWQFVTTNCSCRKRHKWGANSLAPLFFLVGRATRPLIILRSFSFLWLRPAKFWSAEGDPYCFGESGEADSHSRLTQTWSCPRGQYPSSGAIWKSRGG